MGIPFYFRYLMKNHPKMLQSVAPRRVDTLYLDSNSIVYDAFYAITASLSSLSSLMSDKELEKTLIDAVIAKIRHYIARVGPARAFVAFDGVAPLSKMDQQRARRHKHLFQPDLPGWSGKVPAKGWNTNAITPGTRFMTDLSQSLHRAFKTAGNVVLDEHCTEISAEARPGSYVQVGVEDSGTGMPPEVLERIFEPFFTTKDLGKGTGLGLSTTLAIIKGHHGFLRVKSEMGEGTQFQVYLPAETSQSPHTINAPESVLPRGNGELVLVVDDEVTVRQIIQQTLEVFGYRVLVAADGIDASSLYSAHQADIAVVLTDMMMPVMDGLATIQVLMSINPQVRIIAASGLNIKDMVARAMSAGVKHFIPKPYSAETLLKTLAEVLRA